LPRCLAQLPEKHAGHDLTLEGTGLSDIDREVRRMLLRPLQRGVRSVGADAVSSALGRVDNWALAESLLTSLRKLDSTKGNADVLPDRDDPEYDQKMVALAQALFEARRITTAEYVFYAVHPVERIHEERWLNEEYQGELGPISREMDRIERREGLQSDEYWRVGEGPPEYEKLNEEYRRVLDAKLIELLHEFGLDDLAGLKQNKPDKFDELRERGRRAVHHTDETVPAIRDFIACYEQNAQRAAEAGAFAAAITSLGAGMEALLLLRCLKSPVKAVRLAKALPRRSRPRHAEDILSWSLDSLIAVCEAAEWLPSFDSSIAEYNSASLAHQLRVMRNYVHPGRLVRSRPWVEPDESEYEDAVALYTVMLALVGRSGRRPRKSRLRLQRKGHSEKQ